MKVKKWSKVPKEKTQNLRILEDIQRGIDEAWDGPDTITVELEKIRQLLGKEGKISIEEPA